MAEDLSVFGPDPTQWSVGGLAVMCCNVFYFWSKSLSLCRVGSVDVCHCEPPEHRCRSVDGVSTAFHLY